MGEPMKLTREGVTAPRNTLNAGHFGPAVIGGSKPQQPTEAQLKIHPELADYERPEVPDGEFELEQIWREIGAPVFGPLVIGDPEPQKPTAAQLKQQPDLARLHGLEEPEVPVSAEPPRPQVPVTKLKEYLE